MTRWLVPLLLLLLLAPPAGEAGELNELFTFSTLHYAWDASGPDMEGVGTGGRYLGMGGDLLMTLTLHPDPEGGHPNARHFRVSGAVAELGIEDPNTLLLGGLLLQDPIPDGLDVHFGMFVEETHPALGLGNEFDATWTAELRSARAVPLPPAWLLLAAALSMVGLWWRGAK